MVVAAHPGLGVEHHPTQPEIIEAGPESIERVPAPFIIVLPQVRKTMEPEPLDELKASIGRVDDDGRLHLDLLNPLLIADLDPEHAARYIEHANLFWGMNLGLDDFEPNPATGRYALLVSGHRRLRSIAELAVEHEVPLDRIHIATSPYRDISFQEGLIIQLKENTYHPPDPTELAEAIRLSYDFMKLDNSRLTQAECARELGFTPSRVSRALAYSELPDEIKTWVKRKDMSFGMAVTLGRIQEEYRRRFDRMRREGLLSEEDQFVSAEHYAAYEIQTFAYRIFAMLQRSRRQAGGAMDHAQGQLNSMRAQRQFDQDPLDFMVIVESAQRRRGRAVRDLAGFALRGFAAAVNADQGALERALAQDPQAAAALEAALQRYKEQTGVAETLL